MSRVSSISVLFASHNMISGRMYLEL